MTEIDSAALFSERLNALDLELMSAVPSTATSGDRRALLALHLAVRTPGYTYLEIGSEQGGSLQAHLGDNWCNKVFSIDLRVETAPDFRGTHQWYCGNSTTAMRANLAKAFPNGEIEKLETFDMEAAMVPPEKLRPAPSLVFIDAEHTDGAVFKDFLWALKIVDPNGSIAFHDAHLVCVGIRRAIAELNFRGLVHVAGRFPKSSVFVIDLGAGATKRSSENVWQLEDAGPFLRRSRYTRWHLRIEHWALGWSSETRKCIQRVKGSFRRRG